MAEQKKFFEVELPIINQKVQLIGTEKEIGERTVKIDLTRRLRGKSLEAVFKIKQEEGKIKIQPYRFLLLGYFIRRMMRKSVNYVEDSFSLESKNALLRIKPFLITRKKVSRKIRTALRIKTKEEIQLAIKEKNYENVFSEILEGRFQRNLSLKLKKIYPLSFCEIRDIYVEKPLQEIKVQEEKVE